MLTHKQQWRRTRSVLTRSSIFCGEGIHVHGNTNLKKTCDLGLKGGQDNCLRQQTLDDLGSCRLKPKKKVFFSNTIRIILIPRLEEYYQRNIHDDIWWSPSDVANFKDSARAELADFIHSNNCDINTAIHLLYQPNHHEFLPRTQGRCSNPHSRPVNFMDVKPKHTYANDKELDDNLEDIPPAVHPLAYMVD